jgi:hypothetical protein
VNNSICHFRNLLSTIDKMVRDNALKTTEELGERLKTLTKFASDLEWVPAEIQEQQKLLVACAKPAQAVVAKARPIIKRARNNWSGYHHTQLRIRALKDELRHVGNHVVRASVLRNEIDALARSNKERLAKQHEIKAELITITRPDRLRRKAQMIRAELAIEALAVKYNERNALVRDMIRLAEHVTIEISEMIARAKAKADKAARKAAKKAAETVTNPTVTDTHLDPLPQQQEQQKEEELDIELLAFMEHQGLDPENPSDVELAKISITPADRVFARDHLRQQAAQAS